MPDWPGWDSLNTVSRIHSWAELGGIALLGLLVVAEVVTWKYSGRKDFLVEQQETRDKQRHDEEMARLHVQVSSADERAANANVRASEADERAAKAIQGAAEAMAEITQMAEQLAPLNLSPEQQAALVEQLKKFKGQKVTIIPAPPNDPGTVVFIMQLIAVFRDAGWDLQPTPADLPKQSTFPGGVTVSEIANGDTQAGMTLMTELTKNGVATAGGVSITDRAIPGVIADPTPMVRVTVSPKAHPKNIETMNAAIWGMIGRPPPVPPSIPAAPKP